MKKRVFAALLALALSMSLLPAPAFALDGGFSDVSDANVARNVEVLRLMGVVSGDGNGTFRPYSHLTRAEFCKMSVELQGKGDQVVRFRSRTIFPDVRATHWAAGYINYATTPPNEKEKALMHGFPDGKFLPDKDISYAEAVTVLMRVLGYGDTDVGAVWPQGYLDLASAKKLTNGLSISADTAITRAQAAKLFVNALSANGSDSSTLTIKLGEKETTLLSVDLAKGVMRTADGSNPVMVNPTTTTLLRGVRGYVVLNGKGKALTFLPSGDMAGSAGGVIAGASGDAAVVVATDGSTAGFDALADGKTNYVIYRNGSRVNSRALKKYDVATYSAANNAILVCNTRVQAYYESCTPSPSEPVIIETLNGTKLNVLSTAKQGLSEFKPGDQFVLLLTADGQVAGAVKPGTSGAAANAMGYVDKDGKAILFCGASMLDLNVSDGDKKGQVVSIGQLRAKEVNLTAQTSEANGALDLTTNTLGTWKLAENVLALQDGVLTSLPALGVSRLEAGSIAYARRNDANEIDLIVLGKAKTNMLYGRAILEVLTRQWEYYSGEGPYAPHQDGVNGHIVSGEWEWYPGYGYDAPHERADGTKTGHYIEGYTVAIDEGSGKAGEKFNVPQNYVRDIYTGDFVAVQLSDREGSPVDGGGSAKYILKLEKMTKSTAVSKASWVGKEVATANGVTYSIPKDIPCWNADSKTWFKDLDAAFDYGGTMYFYIADNAVRVIEVQG